MTKNILKDGPVFRQTFNKPSASRSAQPEMVDYEILIGLFHIKNANSDSSVASYFDKETDTFYQAIFDILPMENSLIMKSKLENHETVVSFFTAVDEKRENTISKYASESLNSVQKIGYNFNSGKTSFFLGNAVIPKQTLYASFQKDTQKTVEILANDDLYNTYFLIAEDIVLGLTDFAKNETTHYATNFIGKYVPSADIVQAQTQKVINGTSLVTTFRSGPVFIRSRGLTSPLNRYTSTDKTELLRQNIGFPFPNIDGLLFKHSDVPTYSPIKNFSTQSIFIPSFRGGHEIYKTFANVVKLDQNLYIIGLTKNLENGENKSLILAVEEFENSVLSSRSFVRVPFDETLVKEFEFGLLFLDHLTEKGDHFQIIA